MVLVIIYKIVVSPPLSLLPSLSTLGDFSGTHHFAEVFYGDRGDGIGWEIPSQVLLHGGDQEGGQGVRGLAEDVTDEALGDVATDGETEGLLRGDRDEEGLSAGGSRWSLLLETCRVLYSIVKQKESLVHKLQ